MKTINDRFYHKSQAKKTVKQKCEELLVDLLLCEEEDGKDWIGRDWFDPMHGLTEIAYAEKLTLIERQNQNMRLTVKGREKAKKCKTSGSSSALIRP